MREVLGRALQSERQGDWCTATALRVGRPVDEESTEYVATVRFVRHFSG